MHRRAGFITRHDADGFVIAAVKLSHLKPSSHQRRRAAKEAERKRAAEERGQAALHKLRMERAAKQLTAQLEAELQARRFAAASAVAESPLVAAAQPPRWAAQKHTRDCVPA